MSTHSTLIRKLSAITLAAGLILGAVPTAGAAADPLQLEPQQLSGLTSGRNAFSLAGTKVEETYVSPEINTDSSNKIRVIVQLEGQPAAVGKYASRIGNRSLAAAATEASVDREQNEFIEEAADQGLKLDINYQYNTVLNGLEITIPANEIPKLAEISGVKSIQENSTWYPIPIEPSSTDANSSYDINPIKQIGADQAWEQGLTGKGLKVGVVDTGVDYHHPDIAPAYKGGYDSFYQDNDPYEEPPLTPSEDPKHEGFEGTSHGTHVAGTIIGRAANTQSDIVQKGIAYEADLYAYKVLGRDINSEDPNDVSGSTAQVIDGIEHAVKDGVDVINLSLGSDSNKNVNAPEVVAINNAILSGTIVVVANGNAGPGYYTLGSPATSQLAISVGAVNSESLLYTGSVAAELQDAASVTSTTYGSLDFNVMAWRTGQTDFESILSTEPLDVVYLGLGYSSDYSGKDVQDKVVLISRGDISFVEKIAYAGHFGAKAVLLFNGNIKNGEADLSENVSDRDGFINTNLGDSFLFVPTFDLKGTEGRALARAIVDHPDQSLKVSFNSQYDVDIVPGDVLADFSAWGPNGDLALSVKPDILAPGVNVMSTYPAYAQQPEDPAYAEAYQRNNGTSMATPHISGLALLLKQKNPSWNPFDIRSALTNTADVLYDPYDYIYDAYQQGSGRANVAAALQTPALLQAIEPITILDINYNPKNIINYNSSASFGVVAPGSNVVKNLQLKNTTAINVNYTAEVEWHFDHDGVEAALSQSSVSASGGSTSTFQLTLNVDSSADEGVYEGQVTLTSPGVPELHLPFVVYVGEHQPDNGLGVQDVSLTNSLIYPKRSTQNKTDLTFSLNADDTNVILVEVNNLNGDLLGYFTQIPTDSLDEYFSPGVYQIKDIDGQYLTSDESGEILSLPTGTYEVHVTAVQLKEDFSIAKRTDGSKIVYSANTVLRVDNSAEPGSNNGGGSGGGAGAGGGGGSAPAASAAPSSAGKVSTAAQAVTDQGSKQIVIKAAANKTNDITNAAISDADLKAAIDSTGKSAVAIVINVESKETSNVKVVLSAQQIKQLSSLDAASSVIIIAGGSAIALPASLLKQETDGANLEITIAAGDKFKESFTASGATVIGTPVQFEANWIIDKAAKPVQVPNHVFIKRAFTVPGHIQPGTAGVLYEADGKVSPIASVFKVQEGDSTVVTVSRPGFSVYAAVSRKASFSDISDSSAAAHITTLANKFIIEGTGADKFSPSSSLTRAEFTALLVRALGLKSTAAPGFSDVKATDWYANDLAAAFEAGLIQGTGDNKFSPSTKVTRQELTVILSRALKLTGQELKGTASVTFADQSQIAAYAKDSVELLSSASIISGVSGKNGESGIYFNPNAATTRETAASALYLLLKAAGLSE